MTDLEALAKLATEATPRPWHAHRQPDGSPWWIESEDEHSVADVERAQDAAYIAAASPDVVLVLVRVAQAVGDHGICTCQYTPGYPRGDRHAPDCDHDPGLRAALADLDR